MSASSGVLMLPWCTCIICGAMRTCNAPMAYKSSTPAPVLMYPIAQFTPLQLVQSQGITQGDMTVRQSIMTVVKEQDALLTDAAGSFFVRGKYQVSVVMHEAAWNSTCVT